MVIWGVSDDNDAYDPAKDSWTAITATGAPSVRFNHTAVWTGSKMVVWGGQTFSGTSLNDGGVYK